LKESSDGETLIAVGVVLDFGSSSPKSAFVLGTCKRDWLELDTLTLLLLKKGWQPSGAVLHSLIEPDELVQ